MSKLLITITSLILLALLALLIFLSGKTGKTGKTTNTISTNLNNPISQANNSEPQISTLINVTRSNLDHELQVTAWTNHIKNSDKFLDQLAFATMENDLPNRIKLLKLLLEKDPSNSTIEFLIAETCSLLKDKSPCNHIHYENLNVFNTDNGMVIDIQFINAYQNGDSDLALQMLTNAGNTKFNSDFSYEIFRNAEQSMVNFGFPQDINLVVSIVGINAGRPSANPMLISSACKDNYSNQEWQSACYSRGRSLAENSTDSIYRGIGIGLMQKFGKSFDPTLDQLDTEYKQYLLDITSQATLLENAMKSNWTPNTNQWHEFYSLYQSRGHSAGLKYLIKEYEAKIQKQKSPN